MTIPPQPVGCAHELPLAVETIVVPATLQPDMVEKPIKFRVSY